MLLPGYLLLATVGSDSLSSLDSFQRQYNSLMFLHASETNVFKKPVKLFQAWQKAKQRKNMKANKNKLDTHAWALLGKKWL